MKQFWLGIWETIEVIGISLFTVFIIRTYLIQPFLVSGASMEPNFSNGNYLLIDEITYRFREPARGEVVVFRYPHDESVFYIKRLVGLPGERVVVKNGIVTIYNKSAPNGFVLKEYYIPSGIETMGSVDVTLPPDNFFVLGDNRYYSFDSRNWGSVKRGEMVGIARLRLLPISMAQAFTAPQY